MAERVDARDVLDANGKIKKAFLGEIVGHFRRTGPNSWDDYEFVREPGGNVEVLAGVRVQTEDDGVIFRMRHRGRVVRVAWIATDADCSELEGMTTKPRQYFLDHYVQSFRHETGLGATAAIARNLNRK
jgi:hypothetical protein